MVHYPSQDYLLYEEELLHNPFSLKPWLRYLSSQSEAPYEKRFTTYEGALKAMPGCYKLWHAYLRERLDLVRNLPITHSQYQPLNHTFERAIATMHKFPRIWFLNLQSLMDQKLLTQTRRTFDGALRALPVTQHGRVWELYLAFVGQKGVPIETAIRVYSRYVKFDPTHVEDFIEFLKSCNLWQQAAERLAVVLNDDQFNSVKGKTKHGLWLELCDLLVKHANEISGFDVDALIRVGIRKFRDEAGRFWTSLAEYYIRKNMKEKARDIFEEGMASVVTVRDFGVIFDSYAEFADSMIFHTMEDMDLIDEENEEKEEREEEKDGRRDTISSDAEFGKKVLGGFWLQEDKDLDLRLAQLENLMDRRPVLANSVALRQNPHNVEQWHRRVKLFEGNPRKQILTYTEAVRTVDPTKAVGKPHTLWIAFAKMYENHEDIANARLIFDKSVQENYKHVDDLVSLWCEWAEMELRHKNSKEALELMRRATAEPSLEVKQKVATGGNEPVQMQLHKSLRVWTFYVDLEEILGTLESARAVYERMLDLKIATPLIIINHALLLENHKYFEDSFKVYERGTRLFRYPHAKDIWVTYLSKFVERYGKTKLERARGLFEDAIKAAPADAKKPLYLQYAKLEEDYGLPKRAMEIYDEATKAVPDHEKLSVYEVYIARTAEMNGNHTTREIYNKAIESGLPDEQVKTMCLKLIVLERNYGEIDRARLIYEYASQFSDPRSDEDFWNKWHQFEAQHGNRDTYQNMLRIKRSVSASKTHLSYPTVSGNLANKRKETEKHEGGNVAGVTEYKDIDSLPGALERTKRQKLGLIRI